MKIVSGLDRDLTALETNRIIRAAEELALGFGRPVFKATVTRDFERRAEVFGVNFKFDLSLGEDSRGR